MADYRYPDIYDDYSSNRGDLDRDTFIELCKDFNQRVMDKIIYEGRTFHMGSYMSTLSIGRLPRNPSNKQIDWKRSKQLKEKLLEEGKQLWDAETQTGHKWLVYFTNDWYCRFYWSKGYARIPNKTVYQFRATRGTKGNKRKLKDHLREDELNYQKYRKLD